MWFLRLLNSKHATLAMGFAAALAWTPHLAALQAKEIRVSPAGSSLTELLNLPLTQLQLPETAQEAALNVTAIKKALNPDSPPFIFRIYWEPYESGGTSGSFKRLAIHHAWNGALLQCMESFPALLYYSPSGNTIEFADLNFDGYLDLKFLTDSGSGGSYYDCWFYNPAHGRFEFHLGLTNLGNPQPNAKTREIERAGRTWAEKYRYVDGKLTLVERLFQEWRPVGMFEVTERLLDGKMRLVKEELLDPTEEETENER